MVEDFFVIGSSDCECRWGGDVCGGWEDGGASGGRDNAAQRARGSGERPT